MKKIFKSRSFYIGYFSAILSAIFFGSMSVIAKPISIENPLLLAATISLITAAIITPLKKNINLKLTKKNFVLILIIACLGTILAPIIYFLGLRYSTASDTVILTNSEVIFTILLAIIFFKERLKLIDFTSLILITIGIVIITTNFNIFNMFIDIKNTGNLLIIISMLLWSLDSNISKYLTKYVDIISIVQLKATIGCVIIFIIILATNTTLKFNIINTPNLIILSIISFSLPILFFYSAIKNIGIIKTTLILSTTPIFGLLYSTIFLKEKIQDYQLIAVCIMLIGIFILNKKK